MLTGKLRIKDAAGERGLTLRNAPPLQHFNAFVEPFRGS
jgi:hypothetical protein